MRTFIKGLMLVALAATTFGCALGGGSVSQSGTQTDNSAAYTACVMQSGESDVLRLTVPTGTKCRPKDCSLNLIGPDQHVEVWMVRGARTVDEAVGRVGQEIKDEFKNFKAESTTNLTIADTTAKRLVGSGTEADDGDPGRADVVVFKVGDHIFIACNHGEALFPADQQWMLTVVQTAKVP